MAEESATKEESAEQVHDSAVDNATQPLLSHLVALRNSLLKASLAVVALFIPYFIFSGDLYTLVAEPLRRYLPQEHLIGIDVASPFLAPMKLALLMAIFTAMPYILHQLWSFIAPGLYLREKKFALPLLATSIILFYCGMAFCYFLVFPLVFSFFSSVTPDGVVWMTDINSYLSFVIKLVVAFGIVFEIPIAILLLVAAGFTTPEKLSKGRPFIFVGCFVLGMLLTPPDMISQILLAIPAWLLFESGLLLSRFVGRGSKES